MTSRQATTKVQSDLTLQHDTTKPMHTRHTIYQSKKLLEWKSDLPWVLHWADYPIACFEVRLEMHLLGLQTKSADTTVIHAVQAESHVLPSTTSRCKLEDVNNLFCQTIAENVVQFCSEHTWLNSLPIIVYASAPLWQEGSDCLRISNKQQHDLQTYVSGIWFMRRERVNRMHLV